MAAICVTIYLCLTAMVLLATLHKTGHLVYTLDDPYIQLALSDNIAHGHYGINAGEPSSPSSSVLWPLLLVPFSGTRIHAVLPLIWNIFFCTASAWLIGWSMTRWPNRPANPTTLRLTHQTVIAFLLIMAASLVAIPFIGMEHGLEILLALSCAYAFTETLAGRKVPSWCLAAAALGPLVRYEAIAITVAMVVLLAGLRRRTSALALVVAAALPLAGFGIFLHHLGLPPLPTSVLVKSGVFGQDSGGSVSNGAFLSNLLHAAHQTFLITGNRQMMLCFALALIALAWRSRDRMRRFAFAGAAVVPALQVAFGPFGGFHRYEIYATAFASMILLYAVAEYNRIPFAAVLLGLLLISERSMQFTIQTPQAANGIYGQQYQMHRFVTEFFPGRFAAYDIGLVSYQKPESAYVLDLGGLSSIEVARHTLDAASLAEFAARKRIALVMLPPGWPVPSDWILLGQLRLLQRPITASSACVNFYAASPLRQHELSDDLVRFAPTLPPATQFDFAHSVPDPSSCATRDR